MRAALVNGAGDVRVESVPNPALQDPTDAVVRIVAGCICGSDLWFYASRPESAEGSRMGHESGGVVEELGPDATGLAAGDFVVAPFVASDRTCDFCREGLQTSCRHGAHWGGHHDGGQGEYARVPQASGTLVVVPAGFDEQLIPSLPSLSAVLPARLSGASRIILMGRRKPRTDLGRAPGATGVVVERGDQGIARVRELTTGDGTHVVPGPWASSRQSRWRSAWSGTKPPTAPSAWTTFPPAIRPWPTAKRSMYSSVRKHRP